MVARMLFSGKFLFSRSSTFLESCKHSSSRSSNCFDIVWSCWYTLTSAVCSSVRIISASSIPAMNKFSLQKMLYILPLRSLRSIKTFTEIKIGLCRICSLVLIFSFQNRNTLRCTAEIVSGTLFTNHSQKRSLSFSPSFF